MANRRIRCHSVAAAAPADMEPEPRSQSEPAFMDTDDEVVSVVTVPLFLVYIATGVIEAEFMNRAANIAHAVGANLGTCVHCGVACADYCTLCTVSVCVTHTDMHRTTTCHLAGKLPTVLVESDKFDMAGLVRLVRARAPEDHPVASPLCGAGDDFMRTQHATELLYYIGEIIHSEVPQLAEVALDEKHSVEFSYATGVLCDVARGLANFAVVVAADSQRGPRCVAANTPQACCPIQLARAVPQEANLSWIMLMLSFDNPEYASVPLCANDSKCIARKIQTPDCKPFGVSLRAMRSPHIDLSADTHVYSGLCYLCHIFYVTRDLHSAFVFTCPPGIYREEYTIQRGACVIPGPFFHLMRVMSYKSNGHTIHYVDDSALRVVGGRLF